MNRREFVKCVVGGAAAFVSGCGSAAANRDAGKDDRPNIVLIMADDLGYGDVGCYGGTWIRTPNIDALAAGGMRFTDYHSNGAVCSPTRAALLTGRYQQRCGIEEVVFAKGPSRETGMPLSEMTFAEVLQGKGYVTGIFGKWHLGYNVEFNPAKQGFDEFRGYVSGNVDYHSHFDGAGIEDWWKDSEKVPEQGYVTDLITKHAIDFIERHKDKPFCLYLPHEAPHYPYQGRKDPVERLGGDKINVRTKRQDIPRAYKEMVEAMDEGIGRVVETVKRLGLERKTFIFFCSDNGATKDGSNGPLNGFKASLWEGGHRVPAVAYWPGKIKAATTCNQTVLGMDVFPTMASITSSELPAGLKLDGVDLSGVLFESESLPERTVFWRYRKQKAVRKGPWKLLVQGSDAKLFNLDADLGEEKDLAGDKPEIVTMLRGELAAWERGL
ncbi:MAG: sulfatase [Sedimentisphaerales bacterium]|nr:sulfatase [Sedimentisphaerales bacterium]